MGPWSKVKGNLNKLALDREAVLASDYIDFPLIYRSYFNISVHESIYLDLVVTSASHDLALARHTLYLARAPRSSLLFSL
jgi:hypothetical protein